MWSGTLAHNGICGCGRREDWASHFMEHELSAIYGGLTEPDFAVIVPAWLEYVSRIKLLPKWREVRPQGL